MDIAESITEQINRGEWNGDAMMSSDGNTLIFASVPMKIKIMSIET